MKHAASTLRHTADGTIRIFVAEALVLPTGLLIAGFLSRRFGPDSYGAYTLALTLVTWVQGSIAAIFNRVATRFIAKARDWGPVASLLTRAHVGMAVLATLALCLLSPALAALLNEPRLGLYLPL